MNLATAALLTAELEGITLDRDRGLPVEGDADASRILFRLTRSLGEAFAALGSSTFVNEAFSCGIAAHYAAHAWAEWPATLGAVNDWERE